MGRASPPPDSTALLTRSDVDFIRLLRADPVFAGRMLIGDDYPPHTRAQLRAIMKATLGLAVQGRGTAKTFWESRVGILDAALYSGLKVGIVGPSFRQSKYVFDEISRAVDHSPYLQEATLKGPTIIPDQCFWHLRNGSQVFALPLGDGSTIRGARANTLLMDEAAQIPNDVIDQVVTPLLATAADPMMKARLESLRKWEPEILAAGIDLERIARPNRVIMASSAYYQYNHLYRRYKEFVDATTPILADGSANPKYDPKYALFVFDYRDLPKGFMDAGILDYALRSAGSMMDFLMEWCAYFPMDSDGYFSASLIDARVNPNLAVRLFPIPGRRYVMGVDPARTGDLFAVAVWEESEPGQWGLVYQWAERGATFQKMRDIVGGVAARFGVAHIKLDSGGGGLALRDLLVEPGEKEGGLVAPFTEQLFNYPAMQDFDPKTPGDPDKILELVSFSSNDNVREIWTGMKSGLETYKVTLAGKVDPISTGGLLLDAADQIMEQIELTKKEMRSIQMTVNPSGSLHFDAPGNMPTDRVVSACLGYWAARRVSGANTGQVQPRLVTGSTSVGMFGRYR